jgi:hypothetical protein
MERDGCGVSALPGLDVFVVSAQVLDEAPWSGSGPRAGPVRSGAMVSLIGHAHDARTPASTAWLLCGAVALGLIAVILTERSLADAERVEVVYRPSAWRWPGGPGPPSSSTGHVQRRGCSRCWSRRSSPCFCSSPPPDSYAPMRGARSRPIPRDRPRRPGRESGLGRVGMAGCRCAALCATRGASGCHYVASFGASGSVEQERGNDSGALRARVPRWHRDRPFRLTGAGASRGVVGVSRPAARAGGGRRRRVTTSRIAWATSAFRVRGGATQSGG